MVELEVSVLLIINPYIFIVMLKHSAEVRERFIILNQNTVFAQIFTTQKILDANHALFVFSILPLSLASSQLLLGNAAPFVKRKKNL